MMTTTNLPGFSANLMPSLPDEIRDVMMQKFVTAMDSFGSNFNRVSLRGSRIRLIVGGQEVRVEADHLDFVILGISPEAHCVWYKDSYNEENVGEPDAVWAWGEEPPAYVPASVLQKKADGRNAYKVARRLVVAAIDRNPAGETYVDLDNLYVFDVGGMSTYGDDIPIGNIALGKAYSLNNYMSLLRASGVFPAAFSTRMIFDTRQSVPAVRFIPAIQNQQFSLFDMTLLSRIAEVMKDPAITTLLDWRRSVKSAPVEPQSQLVNQAIAQSPVQSVGQSPVQAVVQQPVQAAMQQSAQTITQQPVQVAMQQPVQTVMQQSPIQTVAQQPVQTAVSGLDTVAAQMTQAVQQAAQTVAAQATPANVTDDELAKALSGLIDDEAFA